MEDYIKKNLPTTMLIPKGKNGGCISDGVVYETDKGKIFVKKNSKPKANIMFNGEYEGLKEILNTKTVKVPEPMLLSDKFLVMEHLPIQHLDKFSSQLGEALANLHLHNITAISKNRNNSFVGADDRCVEKFGFHTTTCCGYLPLDNEWCDDWISFYSRQRIHNQIMMIEKDKRDKEVTELWSQLQLKIPSFFKDIIVEPSLVHGDLWSGNSGETTTEGCIFDPAVFYGHHEFDLAIAGMFGGFSNKFFDAYHKLIPKASGFDKRHQLYLLFHHLNHWNHFGIQYKGSTLSIMRDLLK